MNVVVSSVVETPKIYRCFVLQFQGATSCCGSSKGEILGRKLAVTLMLIKPSDAPGQEISNELVLCVGLVGRLPTWGGSDCCNDNDVDSPRSDSGTGC